MNSWLTLGNFLTDENGQQYVYDAWNRLVKVKNSSGTTIADYEYDGQHRRISQTVSGTTTNYFYSANWQVLDERVSSSTRSRYVWSPVYIDALILRDRDADSNGTLEERLWAMQDANYNVTALVDGSGNVVERYAYDAYGQVAVLDASYNTRSSSSYAWVYLWQGLRRDATTTLYHARYREVSATLGRPLQRDPIGFAAGDANVYRWVGNGPTNAVDPLGLEGQPITLTNSTNPCPKGWTLVEFPIDEPEDLDGVELKDVGFIRKHRTPTLSGGTSSSGFGDWRRVIKTTTRKTRWEPVEGLSYQQTSRNWRTFPVEWSVYVEDSVTLTIGVGGTIGSGGTKGTERSVNVFGSYSSTRTTGLVNTIQGSYSYDQYPGQELLAIPLVQVVQVDVKYELDRAGGEPYRFGSKSDDTGSRKLFTGRFAKALCAKKCP